MALTHFYGRGSPFGGLCPGPVGAGRWSNGQPTAYHPRDRRLVDGPRNGHDKRPMGCAARERPREQISKEDSIPDIKQIALPPERRKPRPRISKRPNILSRKGRFCGFTNGCKGRRRRG